MPTKLTNLKVTRVDLVDAGASIDKESKEGAHIVLFKRDGDAPGAQVEKGVELECPHCGYRLETRYMEKGMELPNFCGECGASITLTATGGKDDTSKHARRGAPKGGAMKKFDASALEGEAKTAFEALQAQVTELQGKLTATSTELETTKSDLAKAKAAPAGDGKEDVLKGMDPAARAIVEKAQADAAAAQAAVAKLEEQAAEREAIEKARSLPLFGTTADKFGPMLRRIELGKSTKEDATEIERLMKASGKVIQDSRLFKEVGAPGGAPATGASAYEEARTMAQEVIKSGRAKVLHKAIEIVWKEHPELYARHRTEQQEAGAGR